MRRVAPQSLQHSHDSPRRMRLHLMRRALRIDTARQSLSRVRHHHRGNAVRRNVTPLRAIQKRVAHGLVQHQAPPPMTVQGQRMAINHGTVRSGLVPTLGRTGALIRRSTPIRESTVQNIARAVSVRCDAIGVSRGSRHQRLRTKRKRSARWRQNVGPQWSGDSSMRLSARSHGLPCR